MDQLQILSNAISELTATITAAVPEIAKIRANQTDVATINALTQQINDANAALKQALA